VSSSSSNRVQEGGREGGREKGLATHKTGRTDQVMRGGGREGGREEAEGVAFPPGADVVYG